MTGFAVDPLAGVLRAGVVRRHDHRLIVGDQLQNHRRQHPAQRPARPDATAEHAVKIAEVPFGQRSHRAQDGRDAAMSQGKNGADDQKTDALESWTRECYRERIDQRLRRLGQPYHVGLLSDSPNQHQRMYGGVRFVWSRSSLKMPFKNGKSRAERYSAKDLDSLNSASAWRSFGEYASG